MDSLKSNRDRYNCIDYRKEMMLLGLKRCLADKNLSENEKKILEHEIKKLEKEINMD